MNTEVEIKLEAIVKSDDCVYVQVKTNGWGNSVLGFDAWYKINGEIPEQTFNETWYKVKGIPKSVQRKNPDKNVNKRYVLKTQIPSCSLPQTLDVEKDENGFDSFPSVYENVRSCYVLEQDTIPGTWEEVGFELKTLYKSNDFEWLKTEYPHNHFMIDTMEYHPDILDSVRPCFADSKTMYRIIREHVKKNIDTRVATITSDYNFVFTVSRDVKVALPASVKRNVGTTRRPKWVEEINEQKKVVIYSITTESSYLKDSCVYPDTIVGKNAKDLEDKINQKLDEIMKEINKEFCECPTCKGWGYVEVK